MGPVGCMAPARQIRALLGRAGQWHSRRGLTVLLAILAVTAGGGATHRANGAWTTQVVDGEHPQSAGIGLAAQPTGQAHIGYAFKPDRAARYATNAYGSSPWTFHQGDSAPSVGKFAGLNSQVAVDAAGNVHTTYFDSYLPAIVYASNSSGTWTTRLIEGGPSDYCSAVATDTAGRVYILTIDDAKLLQYTTSPDGPTGVWHTDSLPYSNVSHSVQIVIDADKHAHAVYFSDSDLRYASNATGAWVSAPVAIGLLGGIGSPLALTVDADKHAHVAYLDSSTNAPALCDKRG